LQKFCRLDLFLNCFSSVALSLFSKPTTQNNKKHHNTPIMTKTTSSATTSHATPVKAKTGKLVVKKKILRIGEEPPVTALKQSSPAPVATATMASPILSNQESSSASILTASTAMTALSISSSQSTTTTSSKQSNSSNLVRALDFGNLPVHAKKELYLIDFCDPVDVKSKCPKYLPDASDLPLGHESQLTFLLNNLKVKDIQIAFIKLITIVGGAATTAFLPMPSTKAKVKDFLCLIYNHKSMMIDTDETSYW
jgi:hypothetical protein